jgi:hypothetical protein
MSIEEKSAGNSLKQQRKEVARLGDSNSRPSASLTDDLGEVRGEEGFHLVLFSESDRIGWRARQDSNLRHSA